MNSNIRIAKQLVRIAKSIVGLNWSIPERYNPHGGCDNYSMFDDYCGMCDNDPDYRKFKSEIENAGWKITDESDGGEIDTDKDGETLTVTITVERVSGSKTFDQLYDQLENKEYGEQKYDGFIVDNGYPECDDNDNYIDDKGYLVLVCKKYFPEPDYPD